MARGHNDVWYALPPSGPAPPRLAIDTTGAHTRSAICQIRRFTDTICKVGRVNEGLASFAVTSEITVRMGFVRDYRCRHSQSHRPVPPELGEGGAGPFQ